MDSRLLDMKAWDAVGDTLMRVGIAAQKLVNELVAPIHYRMALIRLQNTMIEDAETLLDGLKGASLDALRSSLNMQIDGQTPAYAVLEALRPGARAEAASTLDRALAADPQHTPSLRALAALKRVDAQWSEVILILERILEADLPPAHRAQAFESLGDVHWREMGSADTATGYYRAALELTSDSVELHDKLLKLDLELEHWDSAVESCQTLIQMVTGQKKKTLQVTYRLTLGEIHLYGLSKPGLALNHYLVALNEMPNYELTYTLLQELLSSQTLADLKAGLVDAPKVDAAAVAQHLPRLEAALKEHSKPEVAIAAFRAAQETGNLSDV